MNQDINFKKYKELKQLNLPEIDKEILNFWNEQTIFEKSINQRNSDNPFVFFEGPPSANGSPGIHHVLSRSLKDLFCRYKTMQGFQVKRKSGWDTHGLPVELSVEKLLGITKDDIGKKVSIEEYNAICRKQVMQYTNQWTELTNIMGYWVDLENPYLTYDKNYIESIWFLLKRLYDKNLIYKGFTIQPYSPAAGTGLSSHELNQPGAYQLVKDTTIIAQFKLKLNDHALHPKLFAGTEEVFFLAWTTTPWTLPSNCALAVGKNIQYVQIECFNQYTGNHQSVILAKQRINNYFKDENKVQTLLFDTKPNSIENKTNLSWKVVSEFKGHELSGLIYEQLFPYQQPESGDAFKVIIGDFVTTEDGTGIVHIAPSFGADDFRVAKQNGIGALTLVDKQGKFIDNVGQLSGLFVKNYRDDEHWENPDVIIAIKLKEENRAFKVEKYEHNYPHCWRTDKPIIYYPLDSWFIKTTAVKERLIELNKTINWKPKSTGEGRFAQWLENLVDWNLSRSRFWGTPLPIWRTKDGSEEKCIGSIAELTTAFLAAKEMGFNHETPFQIINGKLDIDLHKPFVDDVVLVSDTGQPMYRESDLIDVWFDSGAMPFAQFHFPFELIKGQLPDISKEFLAFPLGQGRAGAADFIAEGVDQTRGWFFTLHAIATMVSDSVAYKNVISNGHVLDKSGNKMSKRLGNSVDPFATIYKYGADATRWYMLSNAQPWDNLKFDIEGLAEVQRKFFGTLFNTYSFFTLYANVDNWCYSEASIPIKDRPELDKWVLSLLNSLVKECTACFDDYEPTKSSRAIQSFVSDHLSNWYVRLGRRRFWKSESSSDKLAAYQTLYTCLETISLLIAPIAPFFADFLFRNLNSVTHKIDSESVHLAHFPKCDTLIIDKDLEERMQMAQDISSTILALRKKVGIKVRQPLSKIMIPMLDAKLKTQLAAVEELIKAEVNIKEIAYITDTDGIVVKKIKPNFKSLGKKLGTDMKAVAAEIGNFSQQHIVEIEKTGRLHVEIPNKQVEITLEDVEIISEDIPGWLVANVGNITVALDIMITDTLRDEGNAREFVSILQKLRKDNNLEIIDRIVVKVVAGSGIESSLINYKNYICTEILADNIEYVSNLTEFEENIINEFPIKLSILKS